jgi:uncharacterized protein with GYD domain
MIFINLGKFRKRPTKDLTAETEKITKIATEKEGVKIIEFYWTLGRYDTVVIMEAPDEKVAMKVNLMYGDFISIQTMVAVPREEAVKLVIASH